ncbi:hypothetical protein [Paenibacillus alvei]|uniref:Uncharacterized protein n=1 Tax=Paenibacillus alvei TaxID=44250 RepID=A0AAP7DKP8_PAEAL|nr:hypothetical protein [Paenibacillus alvei]NOJ74123.1 hypothetical protein [Paenibacillus alvei]
MKKALVIISTALFLSTFTSFASAAPGNAPIQSVTNSNKTAYETDPGDISILDAEVLPPARHTGTSAYTGEFTAVPKNGTRLNVYVKNSGSKTVYMDLKRNGFYYEANIPIPAGGQKTVTITGGWSSGDWHVYIYSPERDRMDIQVSARQY